MKPVEKATITDVPQMHELINYFADKGEMLPRPLSELYENIRDCFVVRQGERVIACAALHVSWSDLAELKSLAVAEDCQNQGIGTKWMREVEQHFDQAGRYALFTGQRSERNLHLYQKLGYEPFRRERVSEALTLVFLEKRCCATQESLI